MMEKTTLLSLLKIAEHSMDDRIVPHLTDNRLDGLMIRSALAIAHRALQLEGPLKAARDDLLATANCKTTHDLITTLRAGHLTSDLSFRDALKKEAMIAAYIHRPATLSARDRQSMERFAEADAD